MKNKKQYTYTNLAILYNSVKTLFLGLGILRVCDASQTDAYFIIDLSITYGGVQTPKIDMAIQPSGADTGFRKGGEGPGNC